MSHIVEPVESVEREAAYNSLLIQIRSLVDGEPSLIANLANVSAALKSTFGFWWVGFYLVEGQELVLGPFQGPVACTRIPKGKGVCGTAWAESTLIRVDDVDQFPGHIACSAASRSEIVVPIVHQNQVVAILDIDSEREANFCEIDEMALSALADSLSELFS